MYFCNKLLQKYILITHIGDINLKILLRYLPINECGHINQELELSDREWACNSCGRIIDRDYNAAILLYHGLVF